MNVAKEVSPMPSLSYHCDHQPTLKKLSRLRRPSSHLRVRRPDKKLVSASNDGSLDTRLRQLTVYHVNDGEGQAYSSTSSEVLIPALLPSASPGLDQTVFLLDLPTETLLHIFQDLDKASIYNLMHLCRRLQCLLLPNYLVGLGIPDSNTLEDGHLVLYNQNFEALYELRKAVFLTSVRTITCKFNYPRLLRDPLREVKQLHAFLEKLRSVSEVILNLHRLDWASDEDDEELDARAAVITGLFDLILRKGCESLTVVGGRLSEDLAPLFWQNVLCSQPNPTLVPNLQPDLPLRILNVHSSTLLHPFFCLWLLEIIRRSRLERLSFSHRDLELTVHQWAFVLNNISTPSLESFSFDIFEVNMTDLSSFIYRHPLLKELGSTRGPTLYLCGIPNKSHLCHSNLTTLVMKPVEISEILSLEDVLPALRIVIIAVTVPAGDRLDYLGINLQLAPASKRLKAIESLMLRLYISSPSADWLNLDTDYDENEIFDFAEDGNSAILNSVRVLEFFPGQYQDFLSEGGAVDHFVNWLLTFFPRVCVLSFEENGLAWMDLGPVWDLAGGADVKGKQTKGLTTKEFVSSLESVFVNLKVFVNGP